MLHNNGAASTEYQWKTVASLFAEPTSGTCNKEGMANTVATYCFSVSEIVCIYLFSKRRQSSPDFISIRYFVRYFDIFV